MYYSSPVLSNDKLYICREKGTFYIYQISAEEQKLIHQTQFKDYFFVATPVLIKGKLLMRGEKNLYCIGTK